MSPCNLKRVWSASRWLGACSWVVVVGAASLISATSSAADWPRFRGPNGSGISTDKKIPLDCTPPNLIWKVELPGTGNASPVVAAGQVYLQAATPADRTFVCLELASGKTLWQFTLPGAVGHTHKKNSLASCTACVGEEGVFVPLWDGDKLALFAFDTKGHKLWTYEVGKFTSQHGPGHAPILVGGKVIFVNEQDEISQVLALDAKTGAVAWKADRNPTRSCYSTPVLRERPDGTQELIVTSTNAISAYDVASGKSNWSWDWTGNRLRTVASPVLGEGLVFITAGDGGGNRRAIGLRTDGSGSVPGSFLAWDKGKGFPYVPCMLASGEHLLFISDNGIANCIVAKTGKEVWSERIGGTYSASPLLIDNKVYFVSEDGELVVISGGTKFEKLATSNLGESVFATPAVADGKLLIRGSTHLFAIGQTPKTAAK